MKVKMRNYIIYELNYRGCLKNNFRTGWSDSTIDFFYATKTKMGRR